MKNSDISKLMGLLGHKEDAYIPFQPDAPRFIDNQVTKKPPLNAEIEQFHRELNLLEHYQKREIERIDQFNRQNLEIGQFIKSLSASVESLAKQIKDIKIAPVEVKVHERTDPIKVELKADQIKITQDPVKVEVKQDPIKVEVQLQDSKKVKRTATISHADGTKSTVEIK